MKVNVTYIVLRCLFLTSLLLFGHGSYYNIYIYQHINVEQHAYLIIKQEKHFRTHITFLQKCVNANQYDEFKSFSKTSIISIYTPHPKANNLWGEMPHISMQYISNINIYIYIYIYEKYNFRKLRLVR